MKLTLRTATASDIDEIMRMELKGFDKGNSEDAEVYLERIALFPEGSLIAVVNGTVCGCSFSEIWKKAAGFRRSDFTLGHSAEFVHDAAEGTTIYVASMTVLPEFRSLGLGQQIFDLSIAHIKQLFPRIKSAVLLVNENWIHARSIYRRAGFLEVQVLDDFFRPFPGVVQNGIVMFKNM